MAKNSKLDKDILRNRRPECSILHGKYLSGAGPARHGWFARWPTGKMEYLGKTLEEAILKTTR